MAKYRKFFVAFVGAAVTIAHAFGVAEADEVSKKVIAIFDLVVALGVYWVPNEPS